MFLVPCQGQGKNSLFCHPEQSEGSRNACKIKIKEILRFAQNDGRRVS